LSHTIAVGVAALLWSRPVLGELLPCAGETDQGRIAATLTRIRQSVDPCGESAQIVALLDTLERCTATRCEICIDPQSDRSSFDRRVADPKVLRTITWNPGLQTTIELGCDGNPVKPVRRDATASLLHEITHAVQDCEGLDPSAHELEAVRIENIYRRAAGLCQRTGYGDDPLPPEMVRMCEPGHCLCTLPAGSMDLRVAGAASGIQRTPRAAAVTSADAQAANNAP
jgi:hypothetical protein